MITERSIKLLSSVMLISTNQLKILRLWLTCFEDWQIRILTFAWSMLKTRKTMVSWQAFPSLPSRAPPYLSLAPKTPFPISFKRLPCWLERLKNLSYKEKPWRSWQMVRIFWNSTNRIWNFTPHFAKCKINGNILNRWRGSRQSTTCVWYLMTFPISGVS